MMVTDAIIRDVPKEDLPHRVVQDDLGYRPQGFFLINKAYPEAEKLYESFTNAFEALEENGSLEKIRASYLP